jgi:pimeloyl-ACP methyl ester carboxylesterase
MTRSGCGRWSNLPPNTVIVLEPFIAEIETVRDQLHLDRVYLLGHSWGGMLALEYTLAAPIGVESLILASTPFNSPLWVREMEILREQLPFQNEPPCIAVSPIKRRHTTKRGRRGASKRRLRRLAPLIWFGYQLGSQHPH